MKLYQIIIRRIILLIPVLLGVSIISFSLSHVFQDPVFSYVSPARIELVTDAQLDRIREEHHLNEPVYVRYFYYIAGLLQGDWGIAQSTGIEEPVLDVLLRRFPATIELTLFAITFAVLVGIPLGIISAVRKDTIPDHIARIVALSGVSLPVFWLGLILQYIFAHIFPILPLVHRVENYVASRSPLADNILDVSIPGFGQLVIPTTGMNLIDSFFTLNFDFFISSLRCLVLPAFALSWISMALISRMTRTSMLETLKQDYIILARAKGLSERVVVYKHALRNAMIPTLTVVGISFAALLTGAVLTESIFSWNGIGQWAVQAIAQSDSASIQGFVLLSGLIYILLNLTVDILYTVLDPRISYD